MRYAVNKLTLDEVLRRYAETHGDFYDYTLIDSYEGVESLVRIICPSHGVFEQRARSHWIGYGCWECSREKPVRLFGMEKVLEKFSQAHSERYDYSLVEYVTCHVPVDIICTKHGIFSQRPSAHWRGQGCPSCKKFKYVSGPENLWADMIHEVTGWDLKRNIYLGAKGAIDMVAKTPEIGDIAIEYDGHYWHSLEDSFRKDSDKTNHLIELGYRVIRLREEPRANLESLPDIPGALNFEVPSTPDKDFATDIINKVKGIN